ncbi:MAG TPA: hypothetical protein VKQ52_07075 [Puia sp.]|nr:hypothetical protein [Puia sp.]
MEKAVILALLERYWRAETTVEEEKTLAAWFSEQAPGSLDPDLEPYHALFAYFDEETQVTPGPGFEARILERVGISEPRPVRQFQWGLVSAAAAVLVLAIGLFLLTPSEPPAGPVSAARIPGTRSPATGTPATPTTATRITDTYDNPDQALAAVRHALLIASNHLNEGRKQITNK